MITELITKHLFMSSILLFGALSIFLQWIMMLSLKGYVKASANMKTTRKKLLLNLKNQFETIYGMNYQVRNIAAYVDKYLLKMRFLGITYSAWEKAPFLSIGLATLIAGGEAFYGYWMKKPVELYVEIGFALGAVWVCEFVCYYIFSVRNRKQQIHIQLVDYLENYLTNRLIRTQAGTEQRKLLDAEMEAAFMEGTVDNKELRKVILEEGREIEKRNQHRETTTAVRDEKEQENREPETGIDTEEDMEMLKRLLRDMGKREQNEKAREDLPQTEEDYKENKGDGEAVRDEVAAAGENMEQSEIELLEEFVQSFLA